MKICPFISHMLGDEHQNPLTIGDATDDKTEAATEGVVVLGYDEGQTQKGKKARKKKTTAAIPSHLHCLKEPCRFYQKASGECQFDMIFSSLTKNEKTGTPDISKGVEKIWKFQTKSVAELIKGLGDAEKAQTKAIATLKSDLTKDMKSVVGKPDRAPVKELQKKIDELHKKLDTRDEGLDNLTTTMSDLVVDVQESLSALDKKTQNTSDGVEKIKTSIPQANDLKKVLADAVSESASRTKAPDLSGLVEELAKTIKESLSSHENNARELKDKVEQTLKTQAELTSQMKEWQDQMDSRLDALKSQSQGWEDRWNEFTNSQNQLAGFMEEGKKQRQDDQARAGKKEAKKFNNIGVTSFHNGAFEMARDQFLEAVKIDPEFAEAYNNLGLSYTELDDEDAATEAFKRAVELRPDLHAAYNNLGYIFYKRGSYEQAVEMYNEALGRSTKNSSAYTNLGNAYFKMGKIEEAQEAWNKALELDPANEKAKRNLERIAQGTH